MSRSRNPPPRGQGAARAKQVTTIMSDNEMCKWYLLWIRQQQVWFSSSLPVFPCLCLTVSQMGLLLDLSPDGGMNDEGNDDELEAELLNLVGGGGGGRSQGRKSEGKSEKISNFFPPMSCVDVFQCEAQFSTFCLINMLVLKCCLWCSVNSAPVAMAEIERMAALCMKDLDDEEMGDDDLDDEDLLVTHPYSFHPFKMKQLVDAFISWQKINLESFWLVNV